MQDITPDSKVHGANMGSTWVLLAPDGPHEPCYQRQVCYSESPLSTGYTTFQELYPWFVLCNVLLWFRDDPFTCILQGSLCFSWFCNDAFYPLGLHHWHWLIIYIYLYDIQIYDQSSSLMFVFMIWISMSLHKYLMTLCYDSTQALSQ